MIDVDLARARTPGSAERAHLNNAGASLMTEDVLDTQLEHLRLEARIGGYEAARQAEGRFAAVYESIARLIGAGGDEIALVENATVGWLLAFHSFRFQPGDRILVSEAEYATNFISYLQVADEEGAEIVVIPSDATGQLDVAALGEAVDQRTRLISITHVPTNGGLVNPAEEVGAIANAAEVPFLLDACQSVGQMEVDVESIRCDFLAATGRKFLRGPRGSGFLYVRRSMLDRVTPPMLDLHGARWVEPGRFEMLPSARRYENWEFNHAAVLGLGRAIDEALEWGIGAIERRVVPLAGELRDRLADAGFEVYDVGRRLSAIVSTSVPGVDAAEVEDRLFDLGINVSITSPPSTLLDAERRHLPDLIRISPHYFNTEEELDRVVTALAGIRP